MLLAKTTMVTLAACVASAAQGQSKLRPITMQTPLREFAADCQHPAMKSHPHDRRVLCVSYVNSAIHQIALAKRSEKCWGELESGLAAPGPILDVLFHMATLPEEKNRPVGDALREVVLNVVAKNCK